MMTDQIHIAQDAHPGVGLCGSSIRVQSPLSGVRVEQCQRCAYLSTHPSPASLSELLEEYFTPYLETVPGTQHRLDRLRTLHRHLTIDVSAYGLTTAMDRARQAIGSDDPIQLMRELVSDQLAMLRRYGIWDPRKTPWCAVHWALVREGIRAETHSGVLATAALVEQFILMLHSQGLLPEKCSLATMQTLKRNFHPICCALTPERLALVLDAAMAR